MSQLGLACHNNFSAGRCPLELAQGLSRVALAWHDAGGSAPSGVTLTGSVIESWRVPCVCTRVQERARVCACVRVCGLHVLWRSAAQHEGAACSQRPASQRSLHNAPIFRLLLKVAVNGTHQCGFFNFCGALWAPTVLLAGARVRRWRRACACVPAGAVCRGATCGGVHCRVHSACVARRSMRNRSVLGILAEGAIALSVTLSGGALFAS